MIEGLKPYPEYKESGLPWLGRIPKHWDLKRGKSIFQRIDKRSLGGKEELLTVSSARGLVPRQTATVTMFKAESYAGYKLCWPGDLVINSLWAWGGGLGVSQFHGIISSAYGVYRLRLGVPATPEFIHEVVRSSPFNWELHVRSKGIWTSRLQLTDESFLDAPFHLPPRDEQDAIVRFLDHANGRLERAIRAKRKVIALLHEQKQAIIHRAVTRGLDPTVPLKSSGIPWLGDIPKHWERARLRRVVQSHRRLTYGILKPGEYDPTGRIMVRAQDFSFGWSIPDKMFKVSKEVEAPYSRCRLAPGDLLYTIVGAGTGNVAVAPDWLGGASISRANARVAIEPTKAVPEFIALVLESPVGREQVQYFSKGSAQPVLNLEFVGAFVVPLPPPTEQLDIVKWAKSETNNQNTAIARLQREIELLREYRTRLVADVVTGNLDVRSAARHLPPEHISPEPALNSDELLEPEEAEA